MHLDIAFVNLKNLEWIGFQVVLSIIRYRFVNFMNTLYGMSLGSAPPFSVGAVFSYTIHFLDLAVNRD